MDDERPRTLKKKKKKVRRAAAAAEPMSAPTRKVRARPAAPPPTETMEWTRNHVIVAAIVGLALGGMGGYYAGKGSGGATAGKDNPAGSAMPGQRGQQGQQMPGQPQQPQGRVYIPLASWTPRKGPEHAKVTIVDFSDFQ
jgi:protein-disulfide isomerase